MWQVQNLIHVVCAFVGFVSVIVAQMFACDRSFAWVAPKMHWIWDVVRGRLAMSWFTEMLTRLGMFDVWRISWKLGKFVLISQINWSMLLGRLPHNGGMRVNVDVIVNENWLLGMNRDKDNRMFKICGWLIFLPSRHCTITKKVKRNPCSVVRCKVFGDSLYSSCGKSRISEQLCFQFGKQRRLWQRLLSGLLWNCGGHPKI